MNVISIPQIDVVKILGKKTYKDDHLLSEVDFVDICEVIVSVFYFLKNYRYK